MAYENMTYEVILQRMIDRVIAEYPNLDYREGSLIFNALASAAIELAIAYMELDNSRNESFVNTASREYILIACKDIGIDITQFDASAGTHKGAFNVKVPIGSRWNCDLYNYVVTEYLGLEDEVHTYQLKCESAGTAPNDLTGDLTPITDISNNLTYAKLIECLIEGENETSDEDIKLVYYEHINNAALDGNINQYLQWCNEYEGIGKCKVIPLWNGANTVKVSILSASNRAASEKLIADFQEFIDPGVTGMGDGVAPIGAFVTVSTATELPIDISATVVMKSGYTDVTPINTAIEEYFSKTAYDKNIVAYMNIGAIILSVDSVDSVSNLTINGGTTDINLSSEQIPVLGNTTWTVS